jgi:hypothetical protein
MRKQAIAIATILIAICAYPAGAAAQPAGQAQRDQKAADAMEKARLKAEAKPAQVYIPPPKSQDTKASPPLRKPEVFVATVPAKPGDKPANKPRKKAKEKKQSG